MGHDKPVREMFIADPALGVRLLTAQFNVSVAEEKYLERMEDLIAAHRRLRERKRELANIERNSE